MPSPQGTVSHEPSGHPQKMRKQGLTTIHAPKGSPPPAFISSIDSRMASRRKRLFMALVCVETVMLGGGLAVPNPLSFHRYRSSITPAGVS